LTPKARNRPKVASLTVTEMFVDFAGLRVKAESSPRHCEEPTGPAFGRPADKLRDEAIHSFFARRDGLVRRSLSSGARSRDPLARND
jgi:hypothetical protein